MIKRYYKRPVIIESIQWTGDNIDELLEWMKEYCGLDSDGKLYINTLEGTLNAKVGDYIIKGVRGEFYPCNKDIFKETYEEVD